MKEIKFSVIVPNFNHAHFLKERLDSIFNQTYSDFEVIFLDDASTDDSLAIFETYKSDPRVAGLIKNSENSGSTFKQWKKGIEMARGKYIWIAESDDVAHLNFVEVMNQYIDALPDVGLFVCDSEIIDQESKTIGTTREWFDFTKLQSIQADEKYAVFEGNYFALKALMRNNNIVNSSAVIFKKSVYASTEGVDEQLTKIGDWKLWFEIALISEICFIFQALNFFRKGTYNVTNKNNHQIRSEALRLIPGFISKVRFGYWKDKIYAERSYFEWTFKDLIWLNKYSYTASRFMNYFQKSRFISLLLLPYFLFRNRLK